MNDPTDTSTTIETSDTDEADERQSLERRLDRMEKKLDRVIYMLSKLTSQGEQEKRIHWE